MPWHNLAYQIVSIGYLPSSLERQALSLRRADQLALKYLTIDLFCQPFALQFPQDL